jgi:putative transcriptional regulator
VSRSISIRDPQTRARSLLFGQVVRAHRVAAGLTQPALAERAGCSRASISRIENAAYAPNLDRILKLADALGVAPADLFADMAAPNGDRPATEETR